MKKDQSQRQRELICPTPPESPGLESSHYVRHYVTSVIKIYILIYLLEIV